MSVYIFLVLNEQKHALRIIPSVFCENFPRPFRIARFGAKEGAEDIEGQTELDLVRL